MVGKRKAKTLMEKQRRKKKRYNSSIKDNNEYNDSKISSTNLDQLDQEDSFNLEDF